MLPDRVSNPGPLTYESGALPIALRGPVIFEGTLLTHNVTRTFWDRPKNVVDDPERSCNTMC